MGKKLKWIVFVLYLCVLLRITVFRSGWTEFQLFSGSVELVPFQSIFSYLTAEQWQYFLYLFGGNILWFVPYGMFLASWNKELGSCILLGAVFSLVIELMQFVLGTGYSETEDILLNSLGVVLGWIFQRGIGKMKRSADAR